MRRADRDNLVRPPSAILRSGARRRSLAIVLTDAPPDEVVSYDYIYYEPCADLVIALNPSEKRAVQYAESGFWDDRGTGMMARAGFDGRAGADPGILEP
jgi:hypothetical protein